MSIRCHRLLLLISVVLTLIAACKRQTIANTVEEDGTINSCSTKNEYFPSGPVERHENRLSWGDDQVEWESMFLGHMHEPSLYACTTPADEPQYRFLWDRSLSQPIAARLVIHRDGSGTLFARMLANAGIQPPPRPGKKPVSQDYWYRIILDRQIAVPSEQITHALSLFHRIEFIDYSKKHGMTTDGSDWIFESKVDGKYRLVDFRNVAPEPARNFGLYLALDLAKLPIPRNAIY
jgi:hypothetical protein